jgi:hypothetical protein
MGMNKKKIEAMELSGAESILASEEPIVPSSGFLGGVMERVKEESAMAAPIPFPWKRALPGFVVATAILGCGGVEFVRWGAACVHGNEPAFRARGLGCACGRNLNCLVVAGAQAGGPCGCNVTGRALEPDSTNSYAMVQSSVLRPSTNEKTLSCVTSVTPRDNAWVAIIRSVVLRTNPLRFSMSRVRA